MQQMGNLATHWICPHPFGTWCIIYLIKLPKMSYDLTSVGEVNETFVIKGVKISF